MIQPILKTLFVFTLLFTGIRLLSNPQQDNKPRFAQNDCIAYLVVTREFGEDEDFTSKEDESSKVIDRPLCHVTDLIYKVVEIKYGEYTLEDVTSYKGLQRTAKTGLIDNSYVRVSCKEAKLQ